MVEPGKDSVASNKVSDEVRIDNNNIINDEKSNLVRKKAKMNGLLF